MNIKPLVLILLITLLFNACSSDNQIKAIQDTLAMRNSLIDSLTIQLKIKEDSLSLLKNATDTTKALTDTTGDYKPELIGRWTVSMQCIETSCEGSAIGDVKNEQWEISYEGTSIVAKVLNQKEVTRTYKGVFRNEHIELKNLEATANTQMIVTLQQKNAEGSLEGIREIIKADDCRIRYSVKLTKL